MRSFGDIRICGGGTHDGVYGRSFIEQKRFRFIWLSVNAATTKIDKFTQFPSNFRFRTQQRITEFARVLMWTVIAKGYLEDLNRPRPRTGSSGCPFSEDDCMYVEKPKQALTTRAGIAPCPSRNCKAKVRKHPFLIPRVILTGADSVA